MSKSYQKFLLIVILLFISKISFSQSSEIKIRFIGNCGLHLTDGNDNIYIDFPYKSGAHHYMEYDKSEVDSIRNNVVLLFTHKHSDHYSRRLAKGASRHIYGPWNVKDLKVLNNSLEKFSIQAFKTKHQYSFNHYSYLITWHNRKIYISGDT
jgi:L-ascorbate metabolism protein UlaG (beta-lactamase superfamily)